MLTRALPLLAFLAAALPAAAEDIPVPATAAAEGFAPVPAAEADLVALRHKLRPIVIFADTPDDPAFVEQLRLLSLRWSELAERDVVVIADTDPAAPSAIRTKLRPRGFMFVLIDKDGQVALRKPFPWDARELMRAIDRMPDRREELRNRRATGG
ncbi:MAG: DUF4174 domain-containing protein [Paracoccaceae bacterium]